MEKQKNKKKNNVSLCRRTTAHCLVLPFPSEGVIVPMLQFCKRLKDKGLTITLVLPNSFYKSLQKPSAIPFPIETISDGHDIGWHSLAWHDLTKFQQVGPQALTQLLLKRKKKFPTVDCIVYSSVMPWALDVAKKFGLVGAAFFSYSCAVECLYHHVHQGLIRGSLGGSKVIMVEGLPVLEHQELPFYISKSKVIVDDEFFHQFSNFGAADWLFCNTFYELEEKVVDTMQKQKIGRFRPIGPDIPSMYLDKRLKYDNGYAQLYTLVPGSRDCIKWLKEQPDGSVVYISLGSGDLWYKKMEELAWGIKASKKRFFWEVKASEQKMIPEDFMRETSKQGMVVSWCPRMEVLAQQSIGCFVTNCCWNSILEAISLGVPMVAMPQWGCQRTNAKYVTDVWKTGVRAKPEHDRTDIVGREAVERCIREVMKGERAWEIKRNAEMWRELAKKAVDEGGSSDRNIDEFVASLIHS